MTVELLKVMKFTYFPLKFRGEFSRYLFALGGEDYENVTIAQEDWPALKPNTPLGSLPVLEVDGVQYSQSVAIARFLASRFNLRGKDDCDALKADMIVDTLTGDIMTTLVSPVVGAVFAKDEQKKAQAVENAIEKSKPFLASLEKLVDGDNTFLASGLSYADVALFNTVSDGFPLLGKDFQGIAVEKFPKLAAIVANVEANKKITEYIESRPQSPF